MNSGIVLVKHTIFDTAPISHPVYRDTLKIWYKNDQAIEKITRVEFNEDIDGRKSMEITVLYYTFVDPRSASYYCYKNFSDTAVIIKRGHIDSFENDGGWNFYTNRNIQFKDSPEFLADTVINEVNYKRVKFKQQIRQRSLTSIAYFRCDKKGSMFTFYKSYSDEIGCPMMRHDNFPLNKSENPVSAEIDFVSDTLTREELKVFEAWERNARENPVN
jgi:hypothetical protein